jgi:hypothetical protein
MFLAAIKSLLPARIRQWLRIKQRNLMATPPVGLVDFGNLRRRTPISRVFGFDRGMPIDRYYIEYFLKANQARIHGRVLEVGEDLYARTFGTSHVTQLDVINAPSDAENKTITTDLTQSGSSETYDCIILTQTLNVIFKVQNVIQNVHKALKPSGTLLATFPGISQISRYDMDRWGDYWRFTTLSARNLFEDVFGAENVEVSAYGNVVTAIAFLHGLAVEDLQKDEFDYHDPDYELLITIAAIKN